MLGRLIQPQRGGGDVFGRERLHAFVNGGGARLVALKAHLRKLGAAAQAGFDIAHAHAAAVQIGAQVQAELVHKGFSGAVNIAAGIGVAAGNRADVDDVAFAARHHLRQHLAGKIGQAGDIGGDHVFPVGKIGLVGGGKIERQAGVVDQAVDAAEGFGRFGQRR